MGKQKLREAIFSVRSSRRFFRGHFCGPKKQWIFWTVRVKKGVQPIALGRAFVVLMNRRVVKTTKTLLFDKK